MTNGETKGHEVSPKGKEGTTSQAENVQQPEGNGPRDGSVVTKESEPAGDSK